MSETGFSRLHGLIIGINKYTSPNHKDLEGCVGDAKDMLKYLTDDLGVPPGQLVCLFDEEATRDNILNAFRSHLIENQNIKRFDPIMFFYAGHGDRIKAPAEWYTGDGHMEVLVPYNAGRLNDEDEYVYGIPDRTLGAMLYSLSEAKGNNITVILDSCHSGSGTRAAARARSSHDAKAPDAPPALDQELLGALAPNYSTKVQSALPAGKSSRKYLFPGLETHILLAACHHDEKSFELPNQEPVVRSTRGLFTSALLQALRERDPSATGYSMLIRDVLQFVSRKVSDFGLDRQTPQCEGRNQDRLLFSTQFSVSKGKIGLIHTSKKGTFRIRVGSALGIVKGTEFAVFSDSAGPTSTPIATLFAKTVGPTEAYLSPDPYERLELPPDAYATVIKYNDHSNGVRILVDEESKLPAFWKGVLESLSALPVIWANPGEPWTLKLVPTDNGVELHREALHPDRLPPARLHLKHDLGAKKLLDILTSIVYFHFHLHRQNPDAPVRAQIGMALQELQKVNRSWGGPEYKPKERDWFGDALSGGTIATLQADSDRLFGLTLTNNSKENLFPYLLYYDFEDYSVSCLYEPPSRSMKAPLLASGSLAVGYGSTGAQPFQAEFSSPSSEREYGAFVLMVFSEWVDIAYLQQDSPLEGDTEDYYRAKATKNPVLGIWDKLVVRVEVVRDQ